MFEETYHQKVGILIDVLPLIAEEKCFALHGGTAINLFIRDMPRLSVDIDLTYLPIEDRQTSLNNIHFALFRIKKRIEQIIVNTQVQSKTEIGKLFIFRDAVDVKIEVNLVVRGSISEPKYINLCPRAQKLYNAFVSMPIVPFGQLFGGKICAALDRQHPRDLFDIKTLLANEGITQDIKNGFLLCLLGSVRPMNELLKPNELDQRKSMENQFAGMSDQEFNYEDFEIARKILIDEIQKILTSEDKTFLIGFKNCEPDWSQHDLERFPSVQWKLANLRKLKDSNPEKHTILLTQLKELLCK